MNIRINDCVGQCETKLNIIQNEHPGLHHKFEFFILKIFILKF